MKKIISMMLFGSLIAMSSQVMADEDKNSGYVLKKGATTLKQISKQTMFPATDITVINAGTNPMYLHVNGAGIDAFMPSHLNTHITNYQGSFNTSITLRDNFNRPFWTGVVCPRAVVTIYDFPRQYEINIDNEYCH